MLIKSFFFRLIRMFNSYVSNVLPELGEENMQQVTFQEYLDHRLSKEFQVENPYEQLEYVLTAVNNPSYRSRLASIRFKASTRFFEAIKSYRESLELSGMLFKDIIFRGKPIVTAQQIAERFYSHDTSLRFHNRLEKLKDWLIKKINEVQRVERTKPWVQEEIELLSNDDYHKAHTYLAEKRGFKRESIADYEIEPEALARLIVRQKLKPLRKRSPRRFVSSTLREYTSSFLLIHYRSNSGLTGKHLRSDRLFVNRH